MLVQFTLQHLQQVRHDSIYKWVSWFQPSKLCIMCFAVICLLFKTHWGEYWESAVKVSV